MKPKYLLVFVLILIALILAIIQIQRSLTPYVTIAEAKTKGTRVQIKGENLAGSAMYDMESKVFSFKIKDDEGETLPVIYQGVKPSNFEQAKEVVVRGQYKSGAFEAEEILVKCPTKYQSADGG
ncbi:MAG: cytochrome c maturation protein CcmE [Calditrichaeota bacterium]|nr:cytochrome c maturation protein CcmE [Calditrichota bacterium]MCB0289828.1 cytochrome c maturation protein CcmE [Calditrichota bacterium]MCB0294927.1 cytochrome c maturation protein CcmE [Calditrichota bacterium]MCB0303959.1 cytochrome c maturation protein CcmE [Calditrichota bacterium]MCB0313170.1 cytochrome c maturation protein CcmE [Calditrichota bacterium]